jgi:ketosteroid isomerase-like protein
MHSVIIESHSLLTANGAAPIVPCVCAPYVRGLRRPAIFQTSYRGDHMTNAESIDRLANRFFTAVEEMDGKTLDEIYTSDAVIWHNYDNFEQLRDDNLAMLAQFSTMFKSFKYTDVRRRFFDHGFVQQHVARGVKANGKPFDLFACMVVTVRGDQIARIEEYFDSAQDPR